MKSSIAALCMMLLLIYPAASFADPVTDPAVRAASLVQEKITAPLSTISLNDLSQVLASVMASNMDAAAKERVALALTELAKYQTEVQAKTVESVAGKIFDITVKLISLAASVFAVIKVTS